MIMYKHRNLTDIKACTYIESWFYQMLKAYYMEELKNFYQLYDLQMFSSTLWVTFHFLLIWYYKMCWSKINLWHHNQETVHKSKHPVS